MKLIYKPLRHRDREFIEKVYEKARYNTFASDSYKNYKSVLYPFVLWLALVFTTIFVNLKILNLELEIFLSPLSIGINVLVFYYIYYILKELFLIRLMNIEILRVIEDEAA